MNKNNHENKLDVQKNLDTLLDILKSIEHLEHTIHVLNFDMETICPKEGMDDMVRDITIYQGKIFEAMKSEEYLSAVKALYPERESLTPYQSRLITLLFRDIQKNENITPEFNNEIQVLFNSAYAEWIEAKEKGDYALFKDKLEQIQITEKKIVALRDDKKQTAYDSLLDDYEPGITTADLDPFFDEIEKGIVPLIKAIRSSSYQPRHDFLTRKVPLAKQEAFSRFLLEFNGFDFKRGCLTTTEHPFTDQFSYHDVRVTTHYYEDNFVSNMYSVIHEGGHALFGQNVPEEVFTSHLGESCLSMAKHESVSRFYETVIGRSRAYIHAIYPTFHKIFEEELGDISEEELYEGVNYIDLNNTIRTEADELTYPLHIIIRYRLEKMMMNGTVDFTTLNKTWDSLYEEMLGVKGKNDSQGILQDVHWTSGFGYFPTYTLGSALNCIYKEVVDHALGSLDQAVSEGRMHLVLESLRRDVFAKAPLLDTKEWIKEISGKELSSKNYIEYLQKKFKEIYHLKDEDIKERN